MKNHADDAAVAHVDSVGIGAKQLHQEVKDGHEVHVRLMLGVTRSTSMRLTAKDEHHC